MKYLQSILFLCIFSYSMGAFSQLPNNDPLFQILKAKDSLLFDRAFNHCETQLLELLISEDFEFYHDQSGITSSKKDFLKVMRDGICRQNNPFKSRRELITGSLEVYPLYDQGKLYGLLQRGKHRFFETGPSGIEKEGSTALFSHLWLLEDNDWKLKRVLSFYHHNP